MNTLPQIRTSLTSGNDSRMDDFQAAKSGWNDEPAEVRQQRQRDARNAAGLALARSQALADAAALRSFADASSSPVPVGASVASSVATSASTLAATSAAAATVKASPHPGAKAKPASASTEGIAAALQLHLQRLEQQGQLVSPSKRSRLTEEFRHIKRPLLANIRRADAGAGAGAQRATLIMVTSALPREGKTFFSLNLALSLASEMDTSVLLVDADVVQPELMKRLGVPPRWGLLDLLTRPELSLSDVVLPTHNPKLSLLSSGTPNDLSSELLGSDAMAHLLMSLAARCPDRIVIFDAPPLLVTNEAQVLASRVGQVVMVVEASKSPMASVAQAFAMLEACPVVMAVLNKAPASPLTNGYGSYGI
jgi:protein-tyrosine kinase